MEKIADLNDTFIWTMNIAEKRLVNVCSSHRKNMQSTGESCYIGGS